LETTSTGGAPDSGGEHVRPAAHCPELFADQDFVEAAYGPDHPNVARHLNNLAATMQALEQPEAARPLQERALAIDKAVQSARSGQSGREMT
jgi:Tetratricopeptide repeat